MGNVFIEPRPQGRPEGSGIEDYVVETNADHALATFKTQYGAIEWGQEEWLQVSCRSRPATERQEEA